MALLNHHDRVSMPAPYAGTVNELAPVIPLPSHQTEEGFLNLDIDTVARLTKAHANAYMRVLGRTASAVFHRSTDNTAEGVWPDPERIVVPVKKHGHEFLVTKPDPRSGIKASEAVSMVFLPGLVETDKGSALRLHKAAARYFPDRLIATKPTEGVSHEGQLLPLNVGHRRDSEDMAADILEALPYITNDGPTGIYGTSWGSHLGTEVANQNLAANPYQQRNITRLVLLASAVIPLDVDYQALGIERHFDNNMTDDEVRDKLTEDFANHVPRDLLKMYLKYPEDILACGDMVQTYLFQPHKALHRLSAIYGNFRNVQKGTPGEAIERIARAHELWVIGGSEDPLVQSQISFWEAYQKRYPQNVRQKVVEDMGHLITAHSEGIPKHIAEMESKKLRIAA